MEELLNEFRLRLGEPNVIEGNEVTSRYTCDWSGVNPCAPVAVVRPKNTEDVSYIIRKCNAVGQSVVVQGGMTGLCSGATPQSGELAISLERLVGIEEVDPDAMTMTVQAGTPLEEIQVRALEHGLHFPLDLGARGSCTIGGNIATNAGGTEVIQFGPARSLILGIEVVLPDGRIMSSLNKMLKNNAGFDLKQLFIGTEGTLAIITRAVVRLFPANLSTCTALCATKDLAGCIDLLRRLRREVGSNLSSFEVMWPDYLQFVRDSGICAEYPVTFDGQMFVLAEYSDTRPDLESTTLESVLFAAMEGGLVTDTVVAQSERETEEIWRIREAIAEVFQQLTNAISFDVSVSISSIGALLDQISSDLQNTFPECTKLTYGHLGDSNVHLTISTGNQEDIEAISDLVYRCVGSMKGSISAEHGIGVTKRKYLPLSRSRVEIELMHGLKQLLDPNGILNPNRVLPLL